MITDEIIKKKAELYSQVQYGDPAKMTLWEIDRYDNGIEDFEAGAKWMQEQCPRWVKASEQMPAQGKSVIIWIPAKNHVGWGVANYDTPVRIYYETDSQGLFSDDCFWLLEP